MTCYHCQRDLYCVRCNEERVRELLAELDKERGECKTHVLATGEIVSLPPEYYYCVKREMGTLGLALAFMAESDRFWAAGIDTRMWNGQKRKGGAA